jgi:hypothetical protein
MHRDLNPRPTKYGELLPDIWCGDIILFQVYIYLNIYITAKHTVDITLQNVRNDTCRTFHLM